MLFLTLSDATTVQGATTSDLLPTVSAWLAKQGLEKPYKRPVNVHDLEVALSPNTRKTRFQHTLSEHLTQVERVPHRTLRGACVPLSAVPTLPRRPRGRPRKERPPVPLEVCAVTP
jgi:hypothetical protein